MASRLFREENHMKSKVYFIPVNDSDDITGVNAKLKLLLAESKVLSFATGNRKVAVKLHFGEEGTTSFVRPDHLRVICDEIVKQGSSPFLSDANTLYRGQRLNSKDHLAVASNHGFTKQSMGVDIFIPDESIKEHLLEVSINQKHIKTAKIGRCFAEADGLLAVTHFKGHGLTGFGGTLKNIGMGCATREGKLRSIVISPRPFIRKTVPAAVNALTSVPLRPSTLRMTNRYLTGRNVSGVQAAWRPVPTVRFLSISKPVTTFNKRW